MRFIVLGALRSKTRVLLTAAAMVAALWLLWPPMPSSEPSPYAAPRWLPGGHAQTIYAALVVPRAQVEYRRERWDTPDGDFIDLD